jgi:serine/threonine-protein kinase
VNDLLEQLKTAVGDRFVIRRIVGRGGMATVYLAQDLKHDREVALKVFRPELAELIGTERFFREIRIAAKLNHPNILPVYDSGQAGPFLYYVMPYVGGESLRHRLQRERQITIEEAVGIAGQVAAALDYAHRQGIVHRDVKPENVLVHEGVAMVADFGIALAVHAASGERLTQTGFSIGTPEYMSPEQATGDRQIDLRTDIYSMACVLYEMLAGEPPHTGPTAQAIIARMLTERPADLRAVRDSVPAPLAAAVRRALSKVPADRFPSAGAFVSALTQPTRPSTIGIGHFVRTPIGIAVMLVALALGAAAALALLRRPAADPTRGATGRLSLVLSATGRAFDPVISPDGKMIAYVADEGGAPDLLVRRVSGGQPVWLTNDPALEAHPAFSPDGERIAYTRRDSTGAAPGIWTIPTLGGVAVPVLADARMPAWSPGGAEIAAVERQPGEPERLVAVRPDGGGRRVLLHNEAPYLSLLTPAWAPDGSHLAIVRSTGGVAGEIWLVPADGGGPSRRLARDPPGVWSHHPAFTPDGLALVYSSNRSGATNLWRAPLDGAPSPLTSGAGPDDSPTVALTGAVLFHNSRWRNELFVQELESGARRTLVTHSPFLWAPDFAPDGRELAYSRAEVDGSWHIWVVPVAGGEARQLTMGSSPQIYGRFTADGATLSYFTWSEPPTRMFRVPRGGGPPTPLTPEGEDAAYGEISPDGRRLAYVRVEGGTSRIYVADLEAGAARPLADAPSTLPRWSPDGSRIAYVRDRGYDSGVFLVNADGSDATRLTATGGWPVWWPDGSRIGFIVLGPGGNQALHVVPAEGGTPSALPGVAFHSTNAPFDVSPDGRLIASSDAIHLSDEIWLLER